MKHIFIVNPVSGKGDGQKAARRIEAEIARRQLDAELHLTRYAGHARELAARLSADPDQVVYAAGGDGTIWEVLNGLPERGRLAILPCGTGNDYYRMIDPRNLSFEERLRQTLDGRWVTVDFGQCDRGRFHNCTTMGLDARVNALAVQLYQKYPLPRFSVYGIAALICALKPQIFEIELTTEHQTLRQKALLAAVMNGKSYGNGFYSAPQADLQDGLFDVCLIEPVSLLQILTLMPKYKKGLHTQLRQCRMIRASHVHIRLDRPTEMQSDGENFTADQLTLTLMHRQLTLQVPEASILK